MIKKSVTPEQALARLEALCAAKELSTREAYAKLSNWKIDSSDAAGIVDTLVDRRYIDDCRYVSAYVSDKVKFARWGRRKIALMIWQKVSDRKLIDEALAGIDPEEYYGVLLSLLRAKSKTIKDADTYDGRTRLFRFAASRGFETDLIAKALKEL